MNLEWGDPPKPREPGYDVDWAAVVAALQTRPGRWAKVTELSTAKKAADFARSIKDGRYKSVPPVSVEVVTRTVGGRGGLWMRWVENE